MQPLDTSVRLARLREKMLEHKLDAYIVPMEDAHFSEYIADCDRRIAYISGFTGSAGSAIITFDKAALWTDGRYHNQGSKQLDHNWTLMREGLPETASMPIWLIDSTPPTGRIGFDPQQVPNSLIESFSLDFRRHKPSTESASSEVCRSLIPILEGNLVDLVWKELGDPVKPQRTRNPIISLPLTFTGKSWETKLDEIRTQLTKKGAASVIIFALDEISWLLNLRGSDIAMNPVFFAYLVLTLTDAHLFVDTERGTDSVDLKKHLTSTSHSVTLHAYSEFAEWLSQWQTKDTSAVWVPHTASYALTAPIQHPDRRFIDISPVSSVKAVKTATELSGMREANAIDSLVLSDFLAWLSSMEHTATGPDGHLQPSTCTPCYGIDPPKEATEITLGDYLDQMRQSTDGCVGLSFSTIAGADANGAIIHYRAEIESCLPVTGNSMFLVDSGGQYETGTTDVTRTVHLGTPTKEQIENYTQVLKAHIHLASLIFPDNTAGTNLDAVCRSQMWRSRRNYQHGTGHGVGVRLNVHEGPIGLSGRRCETSTIWRVREPGLRKDMIVTIEPGFYPEGKYGIRLENVYVIVEAGVAVEGGPGSVFLGFDAITLVPFQRKLISLALLSADEVKWIDEYHRNVRDTLLARIDKEALKKDEQLSATRQRTRDWILSETKPLIE